MPPQPRTSARRPSVDIFGSIGCFYRVNIPHQATQPVQLIQEMQNDRNAFVVHAEKHLEILDQPRPREVRVREVKCLSTGERHQPFRFDPGIQRRSVKMRSIDEFWTLHCYTPK